MVGLRLPRSLLEILTIEATPHLIPKPPSLSAGGEVPRLSFQQETMGTKSPGLVSTCPQVLLRPVTCKACPVPRDA